MLPWPTLPSLVRDVFFEIYLHGPSLYGFGMWDGLTMADVCGRMTQIPVSKWTQNPYMQEFCRMLIVERFESRLQLWKNILLLFFYVYLVVLLFRWSKGWVRQGLTWGYSQLVRCSVFLFLCKMTCPISVGFEAPKISGDAISEHHLNHTEENQDVGDVATAMMRKNMRDAQKYKKEKMDKNEHWASYEAGPGRSYSKTLLKRA